MPIAIEPINRPANADVRPAHFNQRNTLPTNTAPGAEPSAGGFGIACPHAIPAPTVNVTMTDVAAALAVRATRRRRLPDRISLVIGILLWWKRPAGCQRASPTNERQNDKTVKTFLGNLDVVRV